MMINPRAPYQIPTPETNRLERQWQAQDGMLQVFEHARHLERVNAMMREWVVKSPVMRTWHLQSKKDLFSEIAQLTEEE